ncbi:FecR family protein [Peristeroidobacter soli]|uniref:FecR family protein n=1 Tax=Peristeroidobacter soli TaxID=2497877 RepID=UPI0013005BB3|nr:FecR domain-containing protein [Peristeroidobacter soli]
MNHPDFIDEPSSRQRAAEFWYGRLDAPDLQDQEWQSFIDWQSNPENQEAFDAAATEHERMFMVRQRSASHREEAPRALPLKLAAVALAICLHLGVIVTTIRYENRPDTMVFVTADKAAGWPLEDGSYLRAEPNTRVEVEFDRRQRSMRLRYGNAFFQVARAPGRPFFVHTQLAVVEARGTAFGVALDDRDAKVTVEEGTVAVSPAAGFAPFYLHPNEQAQVSSNSIERVRLGKDTPALRWATTIQFDRRPAIEAVADFSARSGIKIALDGSSPALASPVSGVFQFKSPVEFAQHVANKTGSPVLVYRPGLATIRVWPPQAPSTR